VGLFTPAFASKRPRGFGPWTCSADATKVELSQKSLARDAPFAFQLRP
jgi:hypothetical protein